MNILYCFNNNFVPQVAASINSVCTSCSSVDQITFHLAVKNVETSNIAIIVKMIEQYGKSANVIKINDLHEYFDFDYDTFGWNEVILTRLLMGEILPRYVEKVIYLDGDTIVRGSLKPLWETELKDNIIGMVSEPTADMTRRKALGIEKYPYYNSGVLLVDLNKWRDSNIGKALIEFYKEKRGRLFAADQDALNCVLKGKILSLSHRYNFFNAMYQYSWPFLRKLDNTIEPLKQWKDIVKNPTIVHYLGEERPWRKGNHHRFQKDYFRNLNMTHWSNTKQEEGWTLYFVAYSLFMKVTYPVQGIRLALMNKLIPSVLKARKK